MAKFRTKVPATGSDTSMDMPGGHESFVGADNGEIYKGDHKAPTKMHNGFDKKGGKPMIGKGSC